MNKKILIVGGVAGGASAAARLRRLDENAEIVMFEKGEYISFANCGLPYYIGDEIKERQKLLVQTPESMGKRFNIDIRINSEIIDVNVKEKKVKVNSKDKGIYEESFDYLILSPGAKPIVPPIEGIESKKIFTLRNVNDTDRIKSYVEDKGIKRAVVIGGGYIGVEMAENLRIRGVDVALVEAAPHILAPFDEDIVTLAEKELQDNNVEVILNNGVKSFKEEDGIIEVTLQDDMKLNADMVILAIGVRPDTMFLKDSGIKLGGRGHIIVNDNLSTNIDGIYAVGDAIEVVDFINGSNTAIPLAGPANKQGRIVADNICGLNKTYKGTQGTSIIKVFNITGASTGNNERVLKNNGIDEYHVIMLHPQSHASYYEGATPITMKLIFDNNGKILGAQAFGYEGVDKRIDDIATVIRLGGSVYDLTELELSYAPPYSSAKDPVNMAGYIAENVLTGKVNVFKVCDLANRKEDESILLDVRTNTEFENGHIEGALNIPVDDLRNRLNEIDKNKEVWVYCQVGLRGYIASRILTSNGFNAKNLTGGYKSYAIYNFKPGRGKNEIFSKKNIQTQNSELEKKNSNEVTSYKKIDACGLSCPGPLMQVSSEMERLKLGEGLIVKASDAGFGEDIKAWCKRTGNSLESIKNEKGIITAMLKKGSDEVSEISVSKQTKENKTMVVFSGDLDKAIASFIIANGSVAMGSKVTMFFTFWGLNILRKHEKVSVQKGFMDKMFGAMMPRGSKRLKLSQMNMMGMGSKMIRKVMKDKNITSLEDLIKSAIDSGVEIVACQMSMDVMGIKKEELIDGVKVGGVGYYLGEAEESNVNLFI